MNRFFIFTFWVHRIISTASRQNRDCVKVSVLFFIFFGFHCKLASQNYCESSFKFSNTSNYVKVNNIGSAPINALYDYVNGFTWECWVKLEQNSSSYRILMSTADNVSYEDIFIAQNWTGTTNKLTFEVRPINTVSSSGPNVTTSTSLNLNQWYHVAAVCDYVGGSIKIYLNGNLEATNSISYTQSQRLSRAIVTQLGDFNPNNTGVGFNGQLDEVRYWTGPRTQAQIQANMKTCLPANTTNLVAYFQADERSGTAASSLVNGNYTGTLANGTSWGSQVDSVKNCAPCDMSCDSTNLSTNLVLHLPFNGNTNDISGNGYNASNSGASLVADRFGNANSAYRFNGTSSKMIVSNFPTSSTDNLSISIWFNSNSNTQSAYAGLVDHTHSIASSSIYRNWVIQHFGSATNCYFGWRVSSSAWSSNGSGATYDNSKWNHLVVVKKGDSLAYYLNCALVSNTRYVNEQTIYKQVADLNIGFVESYTGRFFKGDIDDIRIYHRALSAAEVRAIGGCCEAKVPKSSCDSLVIKTDTSTWQYQNSSGTWVNATLGINSCSQPSHAQGPINQIGISSANEMIWGSLSSSTCTLRRIINIADKSRVDSIRIKVQGDDNVVDMKINGTSITNTSFGWTNFSSVVVGNSALVNGSNTFTIQGTNSGSCAWVAMKMVIYKKCDTQCKWVNTSACWVKDAVAVTVAPNTNYGSHTEFYGVSWSCSGSACQGRSYMAFNLSQIPKNAVIETAKLYLKALPAGASGNGYSGTPTYGTNNSCTFRRVTQAWDENTITWNTKPSTTTTNEVTLAQSASTLQNYTVDLKNLIVDARANPSSSFGFELKHIAEGTAMNSMIFGSSDHPTDSLRPKLEICYSVSGTPVYDPPPIECDTSACDTSNLITNGNFESGNTGFTSDYNYSPSTNSLGLQYTVATSNFPWNSFSTGCNDHTTGSGKMLIANGDSAPNKKVWTATINVQPNKNYVFNYWLSSWSTSPAKMRLQFNGIDIGAIAVANSTLCTWNQFSYTWNSGSSTTATISLIDTSRVWIGNDFAIDDIIFKQICSQSDCDTTKLNQGLVLNLPFNGNTNDISGNGNHATNYGATAAAGKGGAANTAYRFDSLNYMSVAHHSSLNLRSFTITSILKPIRFNTNLCYGNALLGKGSNSTQGNYVYHFGPTSNTVCTNRDTNTCNFLFCGNSCLTSYYINSAPYMSHGAWICAVVTYDSTTKELKQYMDGVFRKSITVTFDLLTNQNTLPLLIGKHSDPSYPYYLNAVVDDIRVYNRALAPSEVRGYCGVCTLRCDTSKKFNYTKCANDSTQLNLRVGSNYQWSPSTGLTNGNIRNPICFVGSNTTYLVTYKDTNGCELVDTVMVNVKTPMAYTPIADKFICQGDSVQLTIPIYATGILWSPNISISSTTSSNPYFSPSTSRTYNLKFWDTLGCIRYDTIQLNVNSLVFTPISDTTICNGDSVGVSIPIYATGIQWSPNTGISSTTIKNPYLFPNTSTTYYLKFMDSFGCQRYDTVNVIVKVCCTARAKFNLSDTLICYGSNVFITNVSTGTITGYNWTFGNASPSSSTSASAPTLTFPNGNIYSIRLIVTDGICFDTMTKSITVIQFKPNAGRDSVACVSSLVLKLGDVPNSAWTYAWTPVSNLDNPTISNPTASINSTSMTYIVTAKDLASGCQFRDTVYVSSSYSGNIVNQNQRICQGDSFKFFNQYCKVAGPYQYSLKKSLSNCDSILYNLNLSVMIPRDIVYDTTYYCRQYIDRYGKKWNSNLSVYDTIKSQLGCDSMRTTLPIKVQVPSYKVKQIEACDDTIYRGKYYNATKYKVDSSSLKSKLSNCDSIITTYNVVINKSPIASISPSLSNPIRITDTLKLTAGGGQRFLWLERLDTNRRIYFMPNNEDTTWHTVRVTDTHTQCWDTAQYRVDIYRSDTCNVFIPNAFSPDGNGINDIYKPQFNLCAKINRFMIFNRIGEKMFETTKNEGWNGRFKGEIMPMGVYVYYLEMQMRKKKVEYKGSFTLFR